MPGQIPFKIALDVRLPCKPANGVPTIQPRILAAAPNARYRLDRQAPLDVGSKNSETPRQPPPGTSIHIPGDQQ